MVLPHPSLQRYDLKTKVDGIPVFFREIQLVAVLFNPKDPFVCLKNPGFPYNPMT